jgi:hypothetical protein
VGWIQYADPKYKEYLASTGSNMNWWYVSNHPSVTEIKEDNAYMDARSKACSWLELRLELTSCTFLGPFILLRPWLIIWVSP